MNAPHYILMIIFYLGLTMLNALLPIIDINTFLISFLIIYLMQKEDASDV